MLMQFAGEIICCLTCVYICGSMAISLKDPVKEWSDTTRAPVITTNQPKAVIQWFLQFRTPPFYNSLNFKTNPQ